MIVYSDLLLYSYFFGRELNRHGLVSLLPLVYPLLLILVATMPWWLLSQESNEELQDVDLRQSFPCRAWNLHSNKKNRWRPQQYHLRCRVDRRQIQRPVRDLPRIWWQPLTWIWLRRIPVPTGRTHQGSNKTKRTPNQRERRKKKRKKRAQRVDS
jgi:hypothetical protein